MSYLIYNDFKRFIQAANLQQVINSDNTILTDSMLDAEETVREYLQTKFVLDVELADSNAYDPETTYFLNQRIYLDGPVYSATSTYVVDNITSLNGIVYRCTTNINAGEAFNGAHWQALGNQYDFYYVKPASSEFKLASTYKAGDVVSWRGKLYTCVIETKSIDWETILQATYYANIPLKNVFPDDPNNGVKYWGGGTEPQAGPGGFPTGWTKGDNRNRSLVSKSVAIVIYNIHYRISPTQIPLHIARAYKGGDQEGVATKDGYIYPDYCALGWLQSAQLGMKPINLPAIQPRSGGRIRWGSKIRNQNGY